MEGFDFETASVVSEKFLGYGEFRNGRGFNRGYSVLINPCSVYTFEFWNYDPTADENRFTIDESIPVKYFDNWYDAAEHARHILEDEVEVFISNELYAYTKQRAVLQSNT